MAQAHVINGRLSAVSTGLRRGLEALYGDRLARVVLYGSHARGDARAWSDIDVAVVLRGNVDRHRELHRCEELVAGLSLEFDTVIHCRFLEEEAFAKADQPLLRNILKEGLPI